jgi:uncharacterized membrane protein
MNFAILVVAILTMWLTDANWGFVVLAMVACWTLVSIDEHLGYLHRQVERSRG